MRERGQGEERLRGHSQAHHAGELQRTGEFFALAVSLFNAGVFSLP